MSGCGPRFIAVGAIAGCAIGAISAGPASGAEGATAIPDSTDFWGRNAFDPEFLPSGPKPLSITTIRS